MTCKVRMGVSVNNEKVFSQTIFYSAGTGWCKKSSRVNLRIMYNYIMLCGSFWNAAVHFVSGILCKNIMAYITG